MLAQMVLIILQVQDGAGQHVDTIEHDDNITGLRLNFVTQPLCLIALAVVKVSIGILLTRLTTSSNFKRFIWGTIIFTILAFVGNFRRFYLNDVRPPMLIKFSDRHATMSAPGISLGHLCQRPVYARVEFEIRSFLQLG